MQKRIILIRNAQAYDFGGGERFPVFIARVIQQEYGMPIIISSSPSLLRFANSANIKTIHGLWWSNQNWSGARVLLFPVYILWQIILFFWYLILFIHIKPHAIHIQSKDDFIAATFAGRIVGAVVIWTDHADLKHIWRNLLVWYKNPIGKLVYLAGYFANAITVISKSEYREVTKYLPKKSQVRNKLKIINNGSPDVKDQHHAARSSMLTFCSTNRLVTDKGINEMINAFRRFHKKHPDSKLVLVGNGPEEDHFKELAKDEPSIVFKGFQSDPLSFVATSDILLQPTYHEGFSISILEGFMMEKPVIATSVGGNLEMIKDNETGLLIPAKNSDSLYEAMERLYKDPALRRRLAKNARAQYKAKFVFDVIVKKEFIPLYETTR
jgi:glycosyltransferase involved in cell wall biosynthesis